MSYTAVSIGLFIFIFVFFSLNAPNLPPETEKQEAKKEIISQYCEQVHADSAPTFEAPPDNATKTGSEDDETLGTPIEGGGGCRSSGPRHQFGTDLSTYRLIRKSVPVSRKSLPDRKGQRYENFDNNSCHFDSADKLNIRISGIDRNKYQPFYPEIAGEISLEREIPSRTRGRNSDLLYFIDYGLIFLLHIDENGNFVELKGGTANGESEDFYLADIYQDIDSNRLTLPPEAFTCDNQSQISSTQVVQPRQSSALAPDQLQLQYFVFDSVTSKVVNGWGIHCKPAIYVYPKQKQIINVRVFTKGFLTYVDPPYDSNKGWTVEANPNGEITVLDSLSSPKTYPYLYYESKLPTNLVNKPKKGWVIQREKLTEFFRAMLPKLGLNKKESLDFTEYWSATLQTHPYYFIGILDQDLINQLEPLVISPKPDFINRVRFYFEGLNSPIQTQAPDITPPNLATQNSLLISEWGGVVKTDKDELFVCNQ